jgi:endonuclease-8
MPEGHSIHRIARQFRANFVGKQIAASSPQGRFAAGAEELDGRVMLAATAVGKQLFLEFGPKGGGVESDPEQQDSGEQAPGDRILRVHLGLYGAWDFAGAITVDPTILAAEGRIGQTNQRGTFLEEVASELSNEGLVPDALPEDAVGSIGAPRRARLRMAESERETALEDFPPAPVGAVRVRLLTDVTVADLRGPTACEVLDPQQVRVVLAKLGPDPMVDAGKAAEDRFVSVVSRKPTPIGLLLMDQSVVSGIGNVYRAELLFRARLDPHTPGRDIPVRQLRALWRDWAKLLAIGVETGQMMTKDGLTDDEYRRAMASRDERHYVYKQTGKKSPRGKGEVVMEDMGGRSLYWAPGWQKRPTPKVE